ncbi:MAG: glycosyltransferase family 2 protein [Candidatus Pacebacteria bacterium]|nr:glycosyltransferase family 2 protein [Candidatus Paceibacterota bacterium]
MITVSLIVLHYKGRKLTAQCLASLKKIKKDGFQLKTVVVINNPEENLTELVKKFPGVTFLETGRNLGFAGGNNFGLSWVKKKGSDWLMILNNDTLVAPDFMIELLKAARKKSEGGIFAPKIYFAPGFEFHRERYLKKDLGKVIWFAGGRVDWANIATRHQGVDEVDRGQFEKVKESEFITGCAMLIKKEVLDSVGLFDPKYFLYYEDADLCQRAIKKGYRLYFVPQAKIWHQVAASSEIGGNLHDYFLVRNQLLFGLRYAPGRSKAALIKQSLRFLLAGRPWQKRGVLDFYLGRLGQGSWGK